jgi:hypothetical protein
MMATRLLRIVGTAAVVIFLFVQSQRVTLAREGETVPGLAMALGALSLLFLVRAFATEKARGPGPSLEKDALWGLSFGVIGCAISLFV